MTKKSLLDFQPEWSNLVRKGMGDYNSLTRDERCWFNIQCLIGTVSNGGLIGHYCNPGGEWNKETIEDLKSLGFTDIVAMLERINQLFPGGTPSRDIYERNAVIDNWEDEEELDDLFTELDEKFFAQSDRLEEALVKFIESRIVTNRHA